MERGEKILFFPDQHLGRNTGLKFGIPLDEMVVWDPAQPVLGGNTEADVRKSQVDPVEGLVLGAHAIHG